MVSERLCEMCGKSYRIKDLAKIRNKYYCKAKGGQNCARRLRLKHREETANSQSDKEKEEIKKLERLKTG